MDVSKSLLMAVAILFLAACGNTKSEGLLTSQSACGGSSRATNLPMRRLDHRFIVAWKDGTYTVEESTNEETFKKDFLEKHAKNIRYAEHDWEIHTQDHVTASASASTNWGQTLINAAGAWNAGYKGQGVIVAVVDTEVDTTHPQLSGQIAYNAGESGAKATNGLDDDGNGYIDDYAGKVFITGANSGAMHPHGSHVSGIVAADPSKGSIQGVAPSAKILPASFMNRQGGGNIGDAVMAMQFAANRGAKIINASWGGAQCANSLTDVFNEMNQRGVLVVVAAGNSGMDIDQYPDYPASFNLPNQVTVAASDSSDYLPIWSNDGFFGVHLAAPGVGIYSTIPGNQIASMDGTSMASPFVAGAAAVLWSAKPLATAKEIKAALLAGVDVVTQMKVKTGGRLNVKKALDYLLAH